MTRHMKLKTLLSFLVLIAVVAVVVNGCSRESREETIDNVASAARTINGGDTENRTPDIVRKQQEAERRRQNREWTSENQARHPIEYCQAQIAELDEMAVRLETEIYKLGVMLASQNRQVAENEKTKELMERQLSALKSAYREADASGSWPMQFNGHSLARERAQEFVVETHSRLETAKVRNEQLKGFVARIERRLKEVREEQVRLVRTKEKAKLTLASLETQQVVDGEKGIADALSALNDSLDALSTWSDEPGFEELSVPTAETETASAFAAIMAE